MDDTLPDLNLTEHVTSFLKGHCIDKETFAQLLGNASVP
jgi:hypothetical protein